MDSRRERLVVAMLIAFFLLVLSVPYVYAWRAADSQHVFGGFLVNYLDGNSYLAKMREGFDGAWLFTLPHTADPGAGAAINLYYLFLGHIAKWLSLPLIIVFHAARLLGAALLALAIYRFFSAIFLDAPKRLWAFGLTLFGSGLGWIALVAGAGFAIDFWVAEAFPFLASYTNAHFPLGLALQVFLLTPIAEFSARRTLTAAAGLLLSIIYPFGWLVSVAALGAWVIWQFFQKSSFQNALTQWGCLLAAGLPFSLYSLWVVKAHPVLAGWSQQNVTPAPALWDLVVGLSPALLLAPVGAWFAFFRGKNSQQTFLAIWLVVGLALVYFPTDLQRRFVSGLFVPLVGLAVFTIDRLATNPKTFRNLVVLILLLSIPTNTLVVLSGAEAATQQDLALYLQTGEVHAFDWLDTNANGKLVIASPTTGLFIPAYSAARVLYGHPFETVQAAARRAELEDFFAGRLDAVPFLSDNNVDFVFYGPRERVLGLLPELPSWQLVYSAEGVEIWAP